MHPDDQALDHEVEDVSPDSRTTIEDSPPTVNDDNEEPPNPNEDTETRVHAYYLEVYGEIVKNRNALQKK